MYITPTHVTRSMDAIADDSTYRHDMRLKCIPMAWQKAWASDADGMVASDSSAAGRKSYMDFYREGLVLTNDAYRADRPVRRPAAVGCQSVERYRQQSAYSRRGDELPSVRPACARFHARHRAPIGGRAAVTVATGRSRVRQSLDHVTGGA